MAVVNCVGTFLKIVSPGSTFAQSPAFQYSTEEAKIKSWSMHGTFLQKTTRDSSKCYTKSPMASTIVISIHALHAIFAILAQDSKADGGNFDIHRTTNLLWYKRNNQSFHPVGHHKTWEGWAYWSNGTSIPKPPTSSWCETNSQKKNKHTQKKKNIGLTISYRETVEQFRTSVVSEQLCYNTKKLLRTTCLPCSQGHEACNMPWQWVHFMCGNHCYMLLIYLFYSKD